MEPHYLIFLFDKEGKNPRVIAGDSNREYIDRVFNRFREMYDNRVQVRRVAKHAAIWAATLPIH